MAAEIRDRGIQNLCVLVILNGDKTPHLATETGLRNICMDFTFFCNRSAGSSTTLFTCGEHGIDDTNFEVRCFLETGKVDAANVWKRCDTWILKAVRTCNMPILNEVARDPDNDTADNLGPLFRPRN